jgi:hypothetical protein
MEWEGNCRKPVTLVIAVDGMIVLRIAAFPGVRAVLDIQKLLTAKNSRKDR